MFSCIFSRQNQFENGAKNKEIPVEHQVQGRENGSTEAQSSGTKRGAKEKTEEVPAKIQRFEVSLDSSGTESDWNLPSELTQYINRYMTTHVSGRY